MSKLRILAAIAAFWGNTGLNSQAALNRQPAPMAVDGKIMAARLVKKVDPVYPEIALRARLEGTVRLSLIINEQGIVTSVRVISGGFPPLQPAAAEAARQWRYAPYLDENGSPVPVVTIAEVLFKLPSAPPDKTGTGEQPEPLPVDGKVMEDRLVKRVDPVYPELALRAKIAGTVRLWVVINERGEVANVKVIAGGGPLLQPAAVEAVRQWRYSPYVDETGRAIPVVTNVNVTFKLPKQMHS